MKKLFQKTLRRKRKAAEAEKKNLPEVLRSTVPLLDMRPLPFVSPEVFSMFDKGFESRVQSFIRKARPDEYNVSFMDAEILYTLRQALKRLEEQRLHHRDLIQNSIDRQLKGEKTRMEYTLQNLKEERQEQSRKLSVYQKALHAGTSLEALAQTS